MSKFTNNYSGIVINQNASPAEADHKVQFIAEQQYSQEFILSDNHIRGKDAPEQTIPPLTGFHLLVEVPDGTQDQIGFDWAIEYYIFGSGWSPLENASGSVLGSVSSGEKVWVEGISDKPIEIPKELLSTKFRIVLNSYVPTVTPVVNQTVNYDPVSHTLIWDNHVVYDFVLTPGTRQKVNLRGEYGYVYQEAAGDEVYYTETICPESIWYSSPNPLANSFVTAYGTDESTPLTSDGDSLSFAFRILGLVADSGTDFLGNSYRSAVKRYDVDNTSTLGGSSEDSIWMSKPNPSRFAIENLYYDIRKKKPQKYGLINLIKNPNGKAGGGYWFDLNDAPTTSVNTWPEGESSIQAIGVTPSGSAERGLIHLDDGSYPIRVRGGQKYSFSAIYNIVTLPESADAHSVQIIWKDIAGNELTGEEIDIVSTGSISEGVHEISEEGFTAPGPAYWATVVWSFTTDTADEEYEYLISKILFVESSVLPDYFDGNSVGYFWEDITNLSASVPLETPTVSDAATVIDRILIDPVTPGVFFNVYYSSEGVAGTDDLSWENKLWTRVNGTFQANKREIHALPAPITAKYIKIEFSHLQAKSYNPGDQPQPIAYKKHPKWVLEYFMARVNAKHSLETRLTSKRIGVIFDGYDLAYNYYLDDLRQEPDQPIELNRRLTEVNDYLKEDSLSDQVDISSLEKIHLAFEPYKEHISTWFGQGSLPSITNQSSTTSYPVEESYAGKSRYTEIRDLDVVIENDMPVMFFFVTCRHKYRELLAPLSHNRAYFVGIKQIAFLRDNYTESFDVDNYIEPAGDLYNIERNDFATINGVMIANPVMPEGVLPPAPPLQPAPY